MKNVIAFEVYDDDGGMTVCRIPSRKEVCWACDGEGSIVNPAIDGNGISTDSEEWADPDFREAYMSGAYDVMCPECKGRNVIDVPNEVLASEDMIAKYEYHLEQLEIERVARRWGRRD